jgi:hypothetical protein
MLGASVAPKRGSLRAWVAQRLGPRKDVAAATAAFALFSLNFGAYRIFGDGTDYYSFDQRLFGDTSHGSGYNFGTGLMNAPFYALGHVAKLAGGSIAAHALPASITIASIAYVILSMAICAWLLGRLQLPLRGLVVGAAVLGSPLWYYASFSPSYTHAADAAAFSTAALCLYQALASGGLEWYAGLAAALGLEVAVRPFNVGVVAGCCVALAAQRRVREAIAVGAGAVATFGVLALVPVALGTGLRTRDSGVQVAGGSGVFGFAPLTPVRMLFSDHRGLFIWTPVTLLAVIGYVLLLRHRGEPGRPYLAVLGAMALGLLAVHASLLWWDGGWSFSMRYLASLLPVYALGLGGLLREAWAGRKALVVVIASATLWSLFLGMNHAFGASQQDGAAEVATTRGATSFANLAWSYSRFRHLVERLR